MRFETSKSTPPHLNRRLQLRMLGFVALIGMIMFVMTAFNVGHTPDGKQTPLPGSPDPSVFDVIDDRSSPLKEGEFLTPPSDDGLGVPDPDWKEPPPLERAPQAEFDPALEKEIARRQIQFDKAILRRVKDNTIGVRRDETDAYFRLLSHASLASTEELEKAGATDVQYINLMDQPDRFRGEPVTVYGDLWRLYEFQAGTNDFDLKNLYEAWIITADSNTHPYRVVFTDLPRELKPGVNLRIPVRVTGYFFKREGYASHGGMHVAPTLLARRVIPFRPPGAPPRTDALIPYMIGVVSAVGLAFLVTLFSFAISDRRVARAALLREMNAPRPSFDNIHGGPGLSVHESLRLLEERDWQADADAVDEEYHDVSAALHARDRNARDQTSTPAGGTASVVAGDEELAARRRNDARAVQSWTMQQSTRNDDDPSSERDRDREQRDAEQVLNSLVGPSLADSATAEPGGAADLPLGRGERNQASNNGLSKLATREREIQQITTRGNSRSDQPTDEQRAAQADLDRDQAAREQELNERLMSKRAELEHERERKQPERELQGSVEIDPSEQYQIGSHDRMTIDRADRPSAGDQESLGDEQSDDQSDGSSGWSRRSGRSRRRNRDR